MDSPITTSSALIRTVTPDALNQADAQAAVDRAAIENAKPELVGIAAHVTRCWEDARSAKSSIVSRLLSAQRARMGRYDPAELANIATFGGSQEYARITDNKCRVAEGWLRDVYLGQTEMPWTLTPTPSPEVPPDVQDSVKQQLGEELAISFVSTGGVPPPAQVFDVQQQLLEDQKQRIDDVARKTADRMQAKMADQLTEGGFHRAIGDFLTDLVTYPAAHFKAPVLRKNARLQWDKGANGKWKPKTVDRVIPMFERVDPFRIFPAPGITDPQEGYMIEWLQYSRADIYNLIGVPGFKEDAIRAVLDQYGAGGLRNWMGFTEETEKDLIVDARLGSTQDANPMIDCLEFHGPVRGKDLLDWGVKDPLIEDPHKDYEADVWLIGQWVIKAQLNPDPLQLRPYYKTSYEEIPGSYWGLGIPDLLADVQGVVNATVRSLVNNMGMASGPQVAINVDRIPAGEDLTTIHPWKIWQIEDSEYGNNASPPIQFFQPQSNVNDLLITLEKFYQFADDFSLIPRVMSGNDRLGGPGRTASGTSMLLSAANKGLKGVVGNVDMRVMTPMLDALYNFNMLNDDDETLKGDCQIVARGAVSLMQLESLQLRRNEFLNTTANPIDQQIIGPEGRAAVLREVAKGLEMDVSRIIPSDEALKRQVAQQQAAAMQPQGAAPAAKPNQEQLANGQATTDNFSPTGLTS